MISTSRIKIVLTSLFAATLLTLLFIFSFGTTTNVRAGDKVFEFEAGAYVKIIGDGGLRFRLKMDENAKTDIGSNDITLYAASKANADGKTSVSDWNGLNSSGKAWKNTVSSDKIYDGGDGFYYVNYLLDINKFSNTAYRTTEFVAFAAVGDGSTYKATSVSRSLQYAASAGALRGGRYSDIKTVYGWLGTEDFPLYISTEQDYDALGDVLSENADLYFSIDGVSDTENYLTAYANGSIAFADEGKLSIVNGSLTTIEKGQSGTTTVHQYMYAHEAVDNTLNQVAVNGTVSGACTLSAHVDYYADGTVTGFKVTDGRGNFILFGFGSKTQQVLIGKKGVGNIAVNTNLGYNYKTNSKSKNSYNGLESVGGNDRYRFDYKVRIYQDGGIWQAQVFTHNSANGADDWTERYTFNLSDAINALNDNASGIYFDYADFGWNNDLKVETFIIQNNVKDGDPFVEISQWSVVDDAG